MPGSSKRVVIIDDEKDVVLYLSSLLGDHGYEVQCAGGGQEGLDLIKAASPDLVCLDILMPGETGLSLYRKIRTSREFEPVPVIIISGIFFEEGGKADPFAGSGLVPPERFLEKPVKPEQFMEAVRAIIG